jgi:hypothetical protein
MAVNQRLPCRYADITCAKGVDYYTKGEPLDKNSCSDRTEGVHLFDHPFTQALAMFIGEFCCFLAYYLYTWISSCRDSTFVISDC